MIKARNQKKRRKKKDRCRHVMTLEDSSFNSNSYHMFFDDCIVCLPCPGTILGTTKAFLGLCLALVGSMCQ